MKKQMNLLEYDDVISDTQRSSWNEVQLVSGKMDGKVLDEIQKSNGLTNFEICALVSRPPHSVSGSITRLSIKGLIVDSGQRKANPKSNKSQIVWRKI